MSKLLNDSTLLFSLIKVLLRAGIVGLGVNVVLSFWLWSFGLHLQIVILYMMYVVLCRRFYVRKQLLRSARLSHRNSVCLSIRPSVRLSDTRVDQSKTVQARIIVGCLEDSSFRNRKAFS